MRSDVMTQAEAKGVYDLFYRNPDTVLVQEPDGLDRRFRHPTEQNEISPKVWADGYIAAFAEAGTLTLVTFDKASSWRVSGAVLLSA